MRVVAISGCAALVMFGAVLFGLDLREARTLGPDLMYVMSSELSVWRWGVASMIAGVLGWVLVALGDSLTDAAFWLSGEPGRPRAEVDEVLRAGAGAARSVGNRISGGSHSADRER